MGRARARAKAVGTRPAAPLWPGATAARDAAGRLVLSQGPIELILDLGGAADEIARAEAVAQKAFSGVLEELVSELSLLRRPIASGGKEPNGPVARRMARAVAPHANWYITPMAAVAGAVADHILEAISGRCALERIAINNGGDIALRLVGDARYRIGISDYRQTARFAGIVSIGARDGIGGIATSGCHGRSHSLGIADAVTVLARCAADADAAATLIANAVDLPDSPKIRRRPARELSPDSDLGNRLVTVDVAALDPDETERALDAGVRRAGQIVATGAARAAFLSLQGSIRTVGAGDALGSATAGREEEN
ncbi:hypothetical protein DEA8626_02020 [Defluviimonas aquaemixtae]|uniref:Uncharacterized protein n=1 Tax=Albidovulum aquaemixtae TaxID=1542388 RepID=A0A2R8B7H8_9RHOB|nr:UPF0280 family protein [Defluviimonas aquaemixtae]SPH18482.1 hypothetical protein DEA8626_02020 [Defluviimonas aquaemixtae]